MLHHRNGLSRTTPKAIIPRKAAVKRTHSLGRWASRPSGGHTHIQTPARVALLQHPPKEKPPPRDLLRMRRGIFLAPNRRPPNHIGPCDNQRR